ncbi:ER degradation-enhancing alpha-mannosidase-like protein 3 [Zophobas morio]|uniref:ER degradation-enhancing alpha-mannosidase-like protein 3 n=1 Tax=Zophobas morio TaxID=2755281 RepID=UPI0030830F1A
MNYSYPDDELKPLSCEGRSRGRDSSRGELDSCMGNFSLTLIDGLDTLAVMGHYDKFKEGVNLVLKNTRYDTNLIVSVFEVTIRVLGGLLSSHVISLKLKEMGIFNDYNGGLLAHALDLGERLLVAFNTPTGLPYPKVNLKTKTVVTHSPVTCLACAGSLFLEFATLSHLSRRSEFYDAVSKTMNTLFSYKTSYSLVPSAFHVVTGAVVSYKSGIGAESDSYYETLFKSWAVFQEKKFYEQFKELYAALVNKTSMNGQFFFVNAQSPHPHPGDILDHLGCFWPGLQALAGDLEGAIISYQRYYDVFLKNNFYIPELFKSDGTARDSNYYLRPEFIESTYYLYKATKNVFYIEVGKQILKSIERCKTTCGFATLSDIESITKEDRMDSYFLAETLKYLYLLFATYENSLPYNVDDYIFNTEAHLFLVNQSYFIEAVPPSSFDNSVSPPLA